MAFSERSLDDYVDVAQRIADFRALHPSGSLRGDWRMELVGTQALVAYRAEAFRTPDDPAPGVGCAWELVPGRTPFTRGSELQNAETSAWGRAIIAVGASDAKKGIASRQEVENRRAERDDGLPTNADGSLSRSRTTDAEKDAAGVMTDAQQAEHTKLQPKQAEVRGRVLRVGGGEGQPLHLPPDPWLDQPAGSLPDPEHQPGTITPAQQRAIMKRYESTDRAVRLQQIGAIVGREVTSTNELSYVDAQLVLGKAKAAAK